mgnify:CR=1 FL=1
MANHKLTIAAIIIILSALYKYDALLALVVLTPVVLLALVEVFRMWLSAVFELVRESEKRRKK